MTQLNPEPRDEMTFIFKLSSPKDESVLEIPMNFTKRGWFVNLGRYIGECTRTGFPYIYRIIDKTGIEVPYKIRGYFERLWHMVDQGTYTHGQIQSGFDDLTNWVKKLNRSKPEGRMWEEEVPASD